MNALTRETAVIVVTVIGCGDSHGQWERKISLLHKKSYPVIILFVALHNKLLEHTIKLLMCCWHVRLGLKGTITTCD